MPRIDDLLFDVARSEASILLLSSGSVPLMRSHGTLFPVRGAEMLARTPLNPLLREICDEDGWKTYLRERDYDFVYTLSDGTRFAANYFWQAKGPAAVFRRVAGQVRSLDSLGLPAAVAALADSGHGLVLVSGPAGSGRSTTLAGMLDRINQTQSRHIVTIESPIECVHQSARCVVSHREVGRHVRSFADGLRGAMRQDADVVLLGELDDGETIKLALEAAEVGMLVLATVSARGVARTIERIMEGVPEADQAHVRYSLASTLQGVISQLLLPTADGTGRCAAVEVLRRNTGLEHLLREGKTSGLPAYMAAGRMLGMQSLDDSLYELLRRKRIQAADAYRKANDKTRFLQSARERRNTIAQTAGPVQLHRTGT